MPASRKTVTLDNLMALGPERLVVILVELADGNAEAKRCLRLELAAQEGGDSIAAEIGKRITALRSARSFVDWQKRREFVRDLDQQRAMIADRVAPIRPDLALDLMWRFLDLAEPVHLLGECLEHRPQLDLGDLGEGADVLDLPSAVPARVPAHHRHHPTGAEGGGGRGLALGLPAAGPRAGGGDRGHLPAQPRQ